MPFNSFIDYPLSWKPDKEKLKRPIYLSLAGQLEKDIACGILRPGTKLPPQRELADYLDINFTTVTRAYRHCVLKGILYAVTGSGTFVASNAAQSVTLSTDNLVQETLDLGFVSSFESCNNMLEDSISSVLKKQRITDFLTYEYSTGMPHQRAAGAAWLEQLGVSTDPDHLAIVSGSQNGLALVLLSLFHPGSRIAVDSYTYANFIELAHMFQIQLVPVPGDGEGMRSDALEAEHRLNPLHGIFLMPSCCNPTTIRISEARKCELASVIQKNKLILIEDEIHAFFTAEPGSDQSGPMQKMIPEQTIFLCGTTKPVCSGLRIAYLVFPEQHRIAVQKAVLNVNMKTSSLDAEIITEAFRSGKAAEIVMKKVEMAKERNRLFDSIFPEFAGSVEAASLYRWLPIPAFEEMPGNEVEQIFQKNGVRIYHSDRFTVGKRKGQAFLRVALSTVEDINRLEEGLKMIRTCIDRQI